MDPPPHCIPNPFASQGQMPRQALSGAYALRYLPFRCYLESRPSPTFRISVLTLMFMRLCYFTLRKAYSSMSELLGRYRTLVTPSLYVNAAKASFTLRFRPFHWHASFSTCTTACLQTKIYSKCSNLVRSRTQSFTITEAHSLPCLVS